MRRFFYGTVSQNGDDFPTITGSGDAGFDVTVEQLAVETAPDTFVNEKGCFFLRSDGNFLEGQSGVVFQPSSVAGGGYPNSIFVDHVAYSPNKVAFFTLNSNGQVANEQIRLTPFIAWTDVEPLESEDPQP